MKRALSSWMPDEHFWREAQAGSACLCPQLARRLPMQTGGRPFARSVALVATSRCIETRRSRPAFVLARAWKPAYGFGTALRS